MPYLLERSGVSLPEDARAWAAEIERLFADQDYRTERRRVAREKCGAATATPHRAGRSTPSSAPRRRRLLIGVGGGLGNMLHTTPMIRNIARRTGRRVDVVAAEDHSHSLCLMQNQDYVGAVYPLRQLILRREYATVFLTYSFGSARVAFNSDNIIWSSDWKRFKPIGIDETIYNLDAAKVLLDVPYDEEDAQGYFCGDLVYTRPRSGWSASMPVPRPGAGSSSAGRISPNSLPGSPRAESAWRRSARRTNMSKVPRTAPAPPSRRCANPCSTVRISWPTTAGVMNIANALGIPLLALFAPTNVESRLPLRPTTSAIVLDKDCAPCELKDPESFSRGQCRCMAEIDVDTVEARLLERMDRAGAVPRQSRIAAPVDMA